MDEPDPTANSIANSLFDGLEEASTEFRRAPTSDADNPQRSGARMALFVVLDYLRTTHVDARLYAPLAGLLGALDDADAGRSNPVTEPLPYGGRKMLIKEALTMASAAAAVTVWKDDAGWPLPKALKEAAKVLGKDPSQLKEFRRNIMKGRAPEAAVKEYWAALKTARASSFLPEEQGHRILHPIRAWVGQKKGT